MMAWPMIEGCSIRNTRICIVVTPTSKISDRVRRDGDATPLMEAVERDQSA